MLVQTVLGNQSQHLRLRAVLIWDFQNYFKLRIRNVDDPNTQRRNPLSISVNFHQGGPSDVVDSVPVCFATFEPAKHAFIINLNPELRRSDEISTGLEFAAQITENCCSETTPL